MKKQLSSVAKSQDILVLPLFLKIGLLLTAVSKVARCNFNATYKCYYEIEQLENQYIIHWTYAWCTQEDFQILTNF